MTTVATQQLIYGALLSGGVSLAAGVSKLLSFSGAAAAFVVGFLIFGFGGLPFAVPLLVFFFTSSLLSRLGRSRKAALNAAYEKGVARDAGQVIANGGVGALLAVLYAFLPASRQIALLYLAAIASVNADTWATEIGGLIGGRPWLLRTFRRADAGTSGAVSFFGLLAALLGAAAVVVSGWAVWTPQSTRLFWKPDLPELIALTWAGFLAAFTDSLLGASLQAQYRCSRCGKTTERLVHCGQPTIHQRGFRWLRNDTVNLLASGAGVLYAWIMLKFFAYPP